MKKEKLYLSTIAADADEEARDRGLGVEIAEYCTAWNMDPENFPGTDAQVREEIAGVSRLVFHAPFNELFPSAIDPRAVQLAHDRLVQAAKLASEQYGVHRMVVHSGFVPQLYFPSWYLERAVPFFRELLASIPPETCLFVENVLEEDPALLRQLAEGISDPRLRLCLDVGHAHYRSPVPVEEWLEALAPYIGHFHIHNNDGSFDTHSDLGDGTIAMAPLLRRIEALCPNATVTLETLMDGPSLDWLAAQGLLED